MTQQKKKILKRKLKRKLKKAKSSKFFKVAIQTVCLRQAVLLCKIKSATIGEKRRD